MHVGQDDVAESRVDERFEMAFFGTCRCTLDIELLSDPRQRPKLTAYTNSRAHVDFKSGMLRQLITAPYFDGSIYGRHDCVSCR